MIHCPQCGSIVDQNNRFCSECGARVDAVSAADPTMPVGMPMPTATQPAGTQPSSPSTSGGKGVFIGAGIVGAVLVAAALMLFLTRPPANQAASSSSVTISSTPAATPSSALSAPATSESPAASSASATSTPAPAQEQPTQPQPAVLDTGDVRAALPASYVEQGYTWTNNNTSLALNNPHNFVVANVLWGEAAVRGNEAKADSYSIGTINHGSVQSEVKLWVYYADSEGKAIYAGAPDAATAGTRPLDDMGVSVEELVSWIELYNADGYVPAQIVNQPAASNSGTTGNQAPFYGVWIGASKDKAEAEALAQEAQSKGLPAEVQVSSEWSNLNPETWFVVTAGHSTTEFDAGTTLTHAISAGYTDAYVKFSGEHL